jgi:hypothetical protein
MLPSISISRLLTMAENGTCRTLPGTEVDLADPCA